jgi:hypothetical protein
MINSIVETVKMHMVLEALLFGLEKGTYRARRVVPVHPANGASCLPRQRKEKRKAAKRSEAARAACADGEVHAQM